ncbi:MAG: hypothetical protein IAI50_20775 [Candidatus Eremiobacteraeota bacterium]|nr:hypothetical protein [Candidatus Eremiobacteraeota bacterium]
MEPEELAATIVAIDVLRAAGSADRSTAPQPQPTSRWRDAGRAYEPGDLRSAVNRRI